MRKPSDFLKENTSSDRSAWDFYQNFRQEFGEDFMSFPEFESRFISFHKGEKRDYDQSSETPMKKFSDMPMEIIGKFVKRMRPVDRVLLRLVSPTLQSIVDSQSPKLKSRRVDLELDSNSCSINFGRVAVEFQRLNKGYLIHDDRSSQIVRIRDFDYEDGVLNGFITIFGHPKSKIKVLNMRMYARIDECLSLTSGISKFLGDSRKINVRKLVYQASHYDRRVNPQAYLLPFLSLLRPGGLRKIFVWELNGGWPNFRENIAGTEQWRQAKFFETPFGFNPIGGEFNADDLVHFAHFNRFDIPIRGLTVDKLMDFVKILANSENFEKCILRGRFQFTPNDYATASNKQLHNRTVREPIEGASYEYIELRFLTYFGRNSDLIIQRKKVKPTKS